MEVYGNENSLEKLKGLQITSLDNDDDEDVEESQDAVVNDGDEDEEDEEDEEPVILGFLEKPERSWSLLRQQFPSKVGSVPAWLDPDNLPSGSARVCDMCGEPLQFVLQVYAPLFEKDSTFHRTLYVFMCLSMTCLLRDQHEQWKRNPEKPSRSVKIFRSQLPRTNPFYSSEAPKGDGTDMPLTSGALLCNWCGTWKGDKFCSGCKSARYCSQKHQVMHWQLGHKPECKQLSVSVDSFESNNCNNGTAPINIHKVSSKSLWPEYELKNEHESEYDSEMSDDDGQASKSLVSMKGMDDVMESLVGTFEGDADKRSWAAFQGRIAKAPEQVLRYCRSPTAKPLWPMSSGRLSRTEVPNCRHCGGPMCFEFQVLPQLLYYFGVKNDKDSLDWATIAVYTCETSCEYRGYKEEFALVQLNSSTPNPLLGIRR